LSPPYLSGASRRSRFEGLIPKRTSREFVVRLLTWGSSHFSSFPWRTTQDPFRVLVAELLLRKTTRSQVSRIFPVFLEKYPSVDELGRARPSEVRKIIRSLGLARVRSTLLVRAARYLIGNRQGSIPKGRKDLLAIPGVGEYTANAVRCFAYGEDVGLVDTNSTRVVQRVFAVVSKRSRPREDASLQNFVDSIIPKARSREFNYAMLDLAGQICLPRNPKCRICPVNHICEYYSVHQTAPKRG